MKTRRGFLASLVALAVAPFAKRRGINPMFIGGTTWNIPQRKIMARIRITEEVMNDVRDDAFSDFMREDLAQVRRDILARTDREFGV